MPTTRTGRYRWPFWVAWSVCAVMVAAWIGTANLYIRYISSRWSGEFGCGILRFSYHSSPGRHYGWEVYPGLATVITDRSFGFAWPQVRQWTTRRGTVWEASVSVWLPTLIIISGVLMLAQRNRSRRPQDRCKHCLAAGVHLRNGCCAECLAASVVAVVAIALLAIAVAYAFSPLMNQVATIAFGWVITLVCVFFPPAILRACHRRRWKELSTGYCRKCGYDLTGNVSGRCPECGTAWKSNLCAP